MKDNILEQIFSDKAIAVIRLNDASKTLQVVDAIAKGGVSIVEITLTTPNALNAIAELSKRQDLLVGAGTVMTEADALAVIERGAKFIVTPILKLDLIALAHRHHVPAMIGAMTPTEIYTAWSHGADVVKVFPAEVVGTAFFKSVKAPLPQIKMMPTGGVTLTNSGEWLTAGACAVGIGSALLDSKAIASNDFSRLTEHAKTFRASIFQHLNLQAP
jgi:2-dehydro-3-deoxyphosphogluconate aldolase/(4S)-4-hydroxy-2-oxoglutarate aldolase